MKRILLILSVAAFAACNNDKVAGVSTGNTDTTATTADVTYPYQVTFSKFKLGDANNAKMLLEIWKDWDNGNLSTHRNYFADSFAAFPSEGPPMMGSADSVISNMQAFRNTLGTISSSIEAIVPLNNLDSNQNYVAVWGKEVRTDKNGKTDSMYLHEVWRMNKDNKFDLMYQYQAGGSTPPPPAPKK